MIKVNYILNHTAKDIYIIQNIIQSISEMPENQIKNKQSLINNLKIQVPALWDFNELQIYFRNHLNQIFRYQNKILKQLNINLQFQNLFMGRYQLRGQLLQSQLQISKLIKSKNILLVDPFNLFQAAEFEFQLETQEVCFQCNNKTCLSIQCACKKAYNCTDAWRYKDYEFHSNTCEKAFDLEDDDDMDQIQNLHSSGEGFVNLGNTCYINASLQFLFSSQRLVEIGNETIYYSVMLKKSRFI
ncbi:hypothetical protein pb186bvf_019888 [Paramecium bursaria]